MNAQIVMNTPKQYQIRNTQHYGEIRNGLFEQWSVTTYCFPEDVWQIIKDYMGLDERFPADFRAMYNRWCGGRRSAGEVDRMNQRIKKEVVMMWHSAWFVKKVRDYEHVWAGDYLPESMLQQFKDRHSLAKFVAVKRKETTDVYDALSTPNNFLESRLKVGDKLKIWIHREFPILFKKGGDKDNVVPARDCYDEKGKSRFYPCGRTQDGNGWEDYTPAIVKDITKSKVKLEYYKYNLVEETQRSMYLYDQTFEADWSAPIGKVAVSWGARGALPMRYRRGDAVEVVDRIEVCCDDSPK